MNLKYLIVQSIVCGIVFVSCQSHEQKADEAFKNYKAEDVLVIDSSGIFKDSINVLLKIVKTNKVVKIEPVSNFKNDLQEKVKANNVLIKHLKAQYPSSSKVFRKILKLEITNNEFIIQLNTSY